MLSLIWESLIVRSDNKLLSSLVSVLFQCFDSVDWVTGSASTCEISLTGNPHSSSLENLWGPILTWSNRQKNRTVKQKTKSTFVIIVIVMITIVVVAPCGLQGCKN